MARYPGEIIPVKFVKSKVNREPGRVNPARRGAGHAGAKGARPASDPWGGNFTGPGQGSRSGGGGWNGERFSL